MNFNQLIHTFSIDPTNLSIKGKVVSIISGFVAIFMVALVTKEFGLHLGVAAPIIVSSIGASAAILFIIPHSPLGQPWPLIGGQLVSATVGMACAQFIPDAALASGCAVAGSFSAMLLLRCLHPPGASTALAPIMGGAPLIAFGYDFVWLPVGINVAVIFVMAIVINRWVLGIEYPLQHLQPVANKTGVSEQDIKQALENMDTFLDIAPEDLNKLLTEAEKYSFERLQGSITCADIMLKNVLTVEYNTSVEKAWHIMYNKKLKAMPVVNKSQQVIGIITWADFFKFIKLTPYASFQEKFRSFIRSTGSKKNKPKVVGDMMSSRVTTVPETTHIAELIALMSLQGHRQIPIVNQEQHLVGMVYQASLIAALYQQQLAIAR
jgi:CBS domain-containing membrane protein